MEIWLKQDKEEFRLPVNPPDYSINNVQQNTSINIIGYGEVNLLGERGLRSVALASFFPAQEYYFCQYKNPPRPLQCVKKINKMKESGSPVRLIMTGVINMMATLETFEHGEKDGTGDISYSVELKEYRRPALKQTKKKKTPIKKEEPKKKEPSKEKKPAKEKTTKASPPVTARDTKKVKSTIYIVKKGDTLMGIAKKITGDSSNWVAIKNQNKIADVRKLQIGTKLTIDVN